MFLVVGSAFLFPPCRKKTFKCLQCGELCLRDPRSKTQRYCCKADCKSASKAQSQQRWASRPENREYFKGAANTERVRQWRKDNPGYWRKTKRLRKKPLQDLIDTYLAHAGDVAATGTPKALQDFIKAQTSIMAGFVSIFAGAAQQEEIANILRRCSNRGADIFAGHQIEPLGSSFQWTKPNQDITRHEQVEAANLKSLDHQC